MKLYKNYVMGCLARLEFCNSLYPKELAVFFPSYFVDHHQIFKSMYLVYTLKYIYSTTYYIPQVQYYILNIGYFKL
jgi:hypothetical protein